MCYHDLLCNPQMDANINDLYENSGNRFNKIYILSKPKFTLFT